jgi:hypothetical protein
MSHSTPKRLAHLVAIVPVKPNIQRISYGWDRMNDVAAKVAGFASASNQPQRLDRSSLPHGAAFGMIWPVASRGGLMPFSDRLKSRMCLSI